MKIPLAEELRPKNLSEVVGQEQLVGDEGFLTKIIASQTPLSILLWGPPGSGKTTLARLYAQGFSAHFVNISAVWSGVADLKKIVKEAEESPLFRHQTILFVDEIHRFNKAQQDGFLPYIEKGTIILVGATTENPSFALNNALLSRLRVLVLNPLCDEALMTLLNRFEERKGPLLLTEMARRRIIELAQGDGRYLLNLIENIRTAGAGKEVDVQQFEQIIQRRAALFDRDGEGHYNLISALHKSVRGSDPDAALYWFARILEGGEEPLFLARRLIRMASEDIGLADPEALKLAIAARDAFQMLGSPEGELALAQVVVYLALAPKSNSLYTAYNKSRDLAKSTSHLNPPKIILNAPTRLMKNLGYGKGYIYDHDTPLGFSGQNYFPEELERPHLYQPQDRGFEREMRKRLSFFEEMRKKINKNENDD